MFKNRSIERPRFPHSKITLTGNNRLNCFLCDYDLCAECCVVAEKQVAI